MRIYNFVNFENLIHMKLYSLLILRKNTKKFKNNFEAQTKTKLGLFQVLYCHVNTTICVYNTLYHILQSLRRWDQSHMRAVAANWCLKIRTRGKHLQHRLSAQRWADGINKWPNDVGAFNRHLGIQKVCLGFPWIHRKVDKTYLV